MTLQPGWNWGEMLTRLASRCLQLNPNKPWKIEVSLAAKSRSGEANNYYWGVCLPLMSEASGYEKEELHDELCKAYFGTKVITIMDRQREVAIRTTTTDESGERNVLGRGDFADFVDYVIRMAAQYYDVVIPPPTPEQVPR